METKILVFDMDGTIADLYSVKNWIDKLQTGDPSPYLQAKPLVKMKLFIPLLELLQKNGYKIIITSWLAKNSTKEYSKEVRKAKREWLQKYNIPYDEIHIVKYGTTKANCTRKHGKGQILIDDNEKIRKGWKLGETINACENIIPPLMKLLAE